MIIQDAGNAAHFARGVLRSKLRRLVDDWPDLMRTTKGRSKALDEVRLAVSVLEMDGPTLLVWANALCDAAGGSDE